MKPHEIVMKLNGPVMPIGDSGEDARRFDNLVTLCDLLDRLHTEIDDVASTNGEHMASVKKAKDYANYFLNRLGIPK